MLTDSFFLKFLRDITPAKRFCVAFSGGLDSTVLLHLLNQLKKYEPDLVVRAVHVHHGLSGNADQWSAHCEKLCVSYQVPVTISHISIKKIPKVSLEELARTKRYEVLKGLLEENEVLVTAHHLNDQAETLLLQLFRGAGPKGLASMPVIVPFGNGFLLRPFLTFKKEVLKHYAVAKQLHWVEDESNQNLALDRNFLRHELLPLIQNRWPTITENLSRAAKHCAEANCYIDDHLKELFNTVFTRETNSLSLPDLLNYEPETQKYLIRYWLQYLKFPLPSTKKLAQLQVELLQSKHDAMPLLCWKMVEIRRFDQQLYAMSPLPPHDSQVVIPWDLQQPDLLLPNNMGLITLNELQQLGVTTDTLKQVTIRFRQGGERCRLKNRNHSHALKKLFQEWRVPPWQRNRIPLVYVEEKLVAVVGYVACD